jgi:hypothetical protein
MSAFVCFATSGLAKISKVDFNCRMLKEKWSVDYFVIEYNSMYLCLVCNEPMQCLKDITLVIITKRKTRQIVKSVQDNYVLINWNK